jgi:hypothetical protein
MVFTFRDPGKVMSRFHKKQLVTLTIGKPEYPARQGDDRTRIAEMRKVVECTMEDMLAQGKRNAS